MDRASAVIVNNGQVALIERERGIRVEKYFVYPGGGLEDGETLESAVVREVLEETGLIVQVERPLATVQFRETTQYYHLVSIVGGEFGTGVGPEMTGEYGEAHGSYKPVWMTISDLLSNPVFPTCVSKIVSDSVQIGWPSQPIICTDHG